MGIIENDRWSPLQELRDDTYECSQLVVPREVRGDILHQIHSGLLGGHLDTKKTLGKLKQTFYRFEVKAEVVLWIELSMT